jgi:hypothetical protein
MDLIPDLRDELLGYISWQEAIYLRDYNVQTELFSLTSSRKFWRILVRHSLPITYREFINEKTDLEHHVGYYTLRDYFIHVKGYYIFLNLVKNLNPTVTYGIQVKLFVDRSLKAESIYLPDIGRTSITIERNKYSTDAYEGNEDLVIELDTTDENYMTWFDHMSPFVALTTLPLEMKSDYKFYESSYLYPNMSSIFFENIDSMLMVIEKMGLGIFQKIKMIEFWEGEFLFTLNEVNAILEIIAETNVENINFASDPEDIQELIDNKNFLDISLKKLEIQSDLF